MIAEGGPGSLVNYWENKVSPQPPNLLPLPATGLTSLTPLDHEYAQRESAALSSIIQNVTDPFVFGLDPCGKAYEVWNKLQREYGAHSDIIQKRREDVLRAARFKDGEKVTGNGGYVEKMRQLLKEANNAGAKINNDNFATILIDSFPESWDPIVSTLHGEKDIVKIVARLSAHGDRVAGHGGHPTSSSSTDLLNQALCASITALAQQIQSLNTTTRRDQKPSNGKSHEANEHCKGIGHTIDECWKIGGGKQGQYPPWWKGKHNAPLPPSSANLAQSAVTMDPVTGVSTSVFALHASSGTSDDTEKDGGVHQMLIAKGTGGLDASKLFSDSGATTYFIKQRIAFSNYITLKDYAGGSSKAGVNLNIAGIGTVAFETNRRNVIMLEKALHCPDISANLISVSHLDKDGWSVTYGKGMVSFVAPDGEEKFTGELNGDLYAINGTLLHAEKHQALTARSMDVAVPMEIWHM